jgi:regulator of sigma E protease
MPAIDCLALTLPLAGIGSFFAGSGQVLLALLGIAFLIFIHEGGHFLAAKWCGVKVEIFSLGFGKRLWGFERGGTDYRLSLLPLGGYVQMLGQDDANPNAAKTDRADDFRNKSVGQRALILIGGVAVNAIFAVLAFLIAFWMGVPFPSPEIGYTVRGGSAEGKLLPGDRVTKINNQEIIAFSDIPQVIAFSGGQEMNVEVLRLVDGKAQTVNVKVSARKGEADRFYNIGVYGLYVVGPIAKDSDAKKLGLQKGDRLVAFKNKKGKRALFSRPSELASLALERPDGQIEFEFERPTFDDIGNPSGVDKLFSRTIPCTAKSHWTLGLNFVQIPRVGNVLPGTSAMNGGLKTHDQIQSIGGRPVTTETLAAVVQEICRVAFAKKEKEIPMVVSRLKEGSKESEAVSLKIPVPEPKGPTKRFTMGFQFGSDIIKGIVPGGPIDKVNQEIKKNSGTTLEPGDRVLKIQTRHRFGLWWTTKDQGFEASIATWVDGLKGKECRLVFGRDGREHNIVVKGEENAKDRYGVLPFNLQQRQIIVQRGFVGALSLGLYSTKVSIGQVLQMLRSLIVRRDVSVKELGGPIKIVQIATKVADRGPGKLIWFLALLSVNLAVLNILPIPVLDGGHLLFVLIEWLKGGPVSENVMIYAQWAGLFVILGLIIVVTFNDILSLLS